MCQQPEQPRLPGPPLHERPVAELGRRMQQWLLLAIAIVSEVIATSALKASEGFSRLWPSLVVVAGYAAALLPVAHAQDHSDRRRLCHLVRRRHRADCVDRLARLRAVARCRCHHRNVAHHRRSGRPQRVFEDGRPLSPERDWRGFMNAACWLAGCPPWVRPRPCSLAVQHRPPMCTS